nr:ribonuclease H-like domain-containing protein [Tanacetum cinerariifolium]
MIKPRSIKGFGLLKWGLGLAVLFHQPEITDGEYPLSVGTGKGLFCLPAGTGANTFGLPIGVPTLDSISASFIDVDTLEVDAHEVESFGLGSKDLTLESLEANSFVLTSEDLSMSSQETNLLDTDLESLESLKRGGGITFILSALANLWKRGLPSTSSELVTGSHRSGNVIKDIVQSVVADTEPKQQLAYEDFKQIEKFDLEEMHLKWKMAMLSVRVHKFEQKARRKIDFDKNESARFNKKKVRCYKCQQRGYFARECRAKGGNDKQRYSSFKIKEIGKKEEDSKALITVDSLDAIEEGVAKIYDLITGDDTKEASTAGDAGEFALMGVTFKVHNCPFGCDNKYNELKKQYNELNEQNSEYFIQVQAYKNSLNTLEKQKRVLQSNQLTLEDKIRVLSIELENTSNLLKHSERIHPDVETAKKELQTTLDNHLVQTEKWRISSKNLNRLIDSSMSVRTKVGLGFTNYIRENKLGWDDSAFSVFTTNSKDVEDRPLINRFAKADSIKVVPLPLTGDYTSLSDHIDLDESQMSYGTKSSTSMDFKSVYNDFVSCDNSDKSSEDLPSFSCNSSDKNENTSRTSCNKNGYSNKKVGHFRKNASSVSKLCFICGSSAHLIKDCDFYEKQIVNKTVGIRVGLVHHRNKVNHLNQFVLQVVLLRTGKVTIPPARPQPVPTGKPKVFAPVPAGRQNRPFPILTDRGYPPSVSSGWWKSIARPMPHFSRPTSSYFQTYTSYVPTMSYTHMKYGKDRWATAVKRSAGYFWKSHRKDAKDEGIFDSGCSRSMTGNKERLDDFQVIQGGKVIMDEHNKVGYLLKPTGRVVVPAG